ncbi:hypothetical protein SAMN06265368_2679 [Cohaesibacter gelatinilyticus]|uniref:Uncharacterized protein n=1 Tax=Cohaesibacter gelatinilyticus TaxID=372072 RepID=A0A285PCZ8_9HYPH|nr:hypothetical protein SAMN06265368_2679 [Cohaesibacter gelatinilyticus]
MGEAGDAGLKRVPEKLQTFKSGVQTNLKQKNRHIHNYPSLSIIRPDSRNHILVKIRILTDLRL